MSLIELDVRGLSCPEPVMLTMDALDDNPNETIKIIGNESHTKTNIEKTLTHQKKSFNTTEENGEFIIVVEP